MLTGYFPLDIETEITLTFAYIVALQGRGYKNDILIGFLDTSTKALFVDTLWDRSKIVTKGQQLTFYSDLCPLTIQYRREWNFLTGKLTMYGIPYTWGFPHKLLIEYEGKIIAMTSTP